MFTNIYTEHLIKEGWVQTEPMSFSKSNLGVEIFFDTSSQIEVYKDNNLIGGYYLTGLDDLLNILEELGLSL